MEINYIIIFYFKFILIIINKFCLKLSKGIGDWGLGIGDWGLGGGGQTPNPKPPTPTPQPPKINL